jgi:hypothetical protein
MGNLLLFVPMGYALYLGKTYPSETPWYLNVLLALSVPFCTFGGMAIYTGYQTGWEAIGMGSLSAILISPIYWPLVFFVRNFAQKFQKTEDL